MGGEPGSVDPRVGGEDRRPAGPEGWLKLPCRGREGGRRPVWRFGDLDLFSDSLITSVSVGRNKGVEGRGLEPDRVGSTLTSSTYQLRDLGQVI